MSRFDTMTARVFALLLVGMLATAALAFIVSGLQVRAAAGAARDQRLVDRIADAVAVLAAAPTDARPERLGVGPEALGFAGPGGAASPPSDPDLTWRVTRRLGALASAEVSKPTDGPCGVDADAGLPPPAPLPGLPGADPRAPGRRRDPARPPPPAVADPPETAAPAPPPPTCRVVHLRLASGERLVLVAPSGPRPPEPVLPFGPWPMLVTALAAAALAWLTSQLATAPLRRLASAARGLGEDLDREPLAAEGPLEVRQAAVAFNTMQTRLRRGLEERTHMLAAITHDLQTPLTRQRLRLERIAEPELREQLLADQEAMRVLIREGLDLARATHDGEDFVTLDVDSLLDSLAEDAVAAGQTAAVTGRCRCTMRTRPQALARCVANLLDNASKYAGEAELRADRAGATVTIRVLDRGPGLPPDELESIFEPFRRGEVSRSRETGGAGLGLTIARLLAERCGASLTLHNRECGGLEARLSAMAASSRD